MVDETSNPAADLSGLGVVIHWPKGLTVRILRPYRQNSRTRVNLHLGQEHPAGIAAQELLERTYNPSVEKVGLVSNNNNKRVDQPRVIERPMLVEDSSEVRMLCLETSDI